MRIRRLAPAIGAFLCLVAACPASAATVYYTGNGQSKTLHYDAAPGEHNVVQLLPIVDDKGVDQIWVVDYAPVSAGAGCNQTASGNVFCPRAPLVGVDIKLGDGDDSVYAPFPVPTHLAGEDGNDSLVASDGDDTLDGGNGDDYLSASSGADSLSGGAGYDTASYARALQQAISLNDVADDGAAGEGDNVHSDIEEIHGGSEADEITGSSAAERIYGGAGGDTIHGGGGNDELWGGEYYDSACSSDSVYGDGGDDTLTIGGAGSLADGGDGTDTLRPWQVCSDLSVRGGDGTDTVDFELEGAGYVSLDDVADDAPGAGNYHRDIENLRGGYGSDVLVGNALTNEIDGRGGNDLIDGAGGADTLAGGDGSDVVDYSSRTSPLHVDLDGETGDDGEAGEGDSVGADVEGIWGGSANDVLAGGPGDDSIEGGPGADQISGGPGDDEADYSLRSAAVTADTSGSGGDDGEPGEGDSIAADVEDLAGGDGNDSLTGSASANLLDGGAGDDMLAGGDGDDTLFGGDGDDSLDGGAGVDYFMADAGDDTVVMQDTRTEHGYCGDGADAVTADSSDVVDSDCEEVTLPPLPTRTSTTPVRPPRIPIIRTLPPPPPAPVPAIADTTAPKGSLLVSHVSLQRALRIGQRAVVSCDTTCSTRVKLVLPAKAARRLGLKHVKGPVIVATGVRAAVNSRHYVVVIRFARKLRSKLAKAKRLSLQLHAVFADSADNRRGALRKLVLR